MKTMFILFLWGITSLATSGCEETADELQAQVDNLEFELVVLDEEGEQQSVFEPFTDITFAVRITNNSDTDFLWEYAYDCRLLQSEEFLLVYKEVNTSEIGGSKIDSIGKPYPYPIDCLLSMIPPQSISLGSELLLQWPWSANPENDPLGPGKYFTAFHHTLNMDGYQKKLDLRVDFEVK